MADRNNIAAIILFTISITLAPADDFWSLDPHRIEDRGYLNDFVEGMTDNELVGQILLLGYEGSVPTNQFKSWIRERGIGGVKIFGWNVGTLSALAESISTMQEQAQGSRLKIPLFVATDQEGGWVRHVKGETSETPGNLALGATRQPMDAYRSGFLIGSELRILGINMNFAPTVDVYTNPEAHVIGPRAFSDDPLQTAFLSLAFFHGMQNAGIVCTAKHFPGHGNSSEDSHGTLPVIPGDLPVLWERELLPYRMLIKEGLPAIMSGHLNYPEITEKNLPATLSSYFLTDLLREKMEFDGIVVTDDLRMEGVMMEGLSTPEVCAEAIRAGNDVLMISRDPRMHERIWIELLETMDSEPGFKENIEASVVRIVREKARQYLIERDSTVTTTIPAPESTDFFFDLACRSTTLISSSAIPVSNAGSVLLAGQFRDFLNQGSLRFAEADTHYFTYSPFYRATASEVQAFVERAKNYDTIIFCLANPRSLAFLKALQPLADRVIVLSVLTPVYLREVSWVASAVAAYGTSSDSFKAGFGAILGDFEPEGILPVSVQ